MKYQSKRRVHIYVPSTFPLRQDGAFPFSIRGAVKLHHAINCMVLCANVVTQHPEIGGARSLRTTEGPSWWYPMLVLGALCSLLDPFCWH